MDADAHVVALEASRRPALAQLADGGLHLERGLHRLLPLVLVGLRAAEDRQHGVADELVHGRVVVEEDGHERRKHVVQHVDDISGVHLFRGRREAAHVGQEDRHRRHALTAETHASRIVAPLLGHAWRELAQQARAHRVQGSDLRLQAQRPHRGARLTGRGAEQLEVVDAERIGSRLAADVQHSHDLRPVEHRRVQGAHLADVDHAQR